MAGATSGLAASSPPMTHNLVRVRGVRTHVAKHRASRLTSRLRSTTVLAGTTIGLALTLALPASAVSSDPPCQPAHKPGVGLCPADGIDRLPVYVDVPPLLCAHLIVDTRGGNPRISSHDCPLAPVGGDPAPAPVPAPAIPTRTGDTADPAAVTVGRTSFGHFQ